MGMFDTFRGEIKCKDCGNTFEFEEQTKDYDCILSDLELGDYIDKGNTNYFYVLKYTCPHCQEQQIISIAIKRGQVVGFFHYEELSENFLDTLDNIEDGYAKKLRYEKMCEEKIGFDKKIFIYQKIQPKDIIYALDSKWIIDEVYTEEIKSDSKLAEVFFKRNFICEAYCGSDRRIIVLRENCPIEIKEYNFTQKETWEKEDYEKRYITQIFCELIKI